MAKRASIQNWAVDKIASSLDPKARVIEVGCGSGFTSTQLKQRGFTVCCADVGNWHADRGDLEHTSGADLSGSLPFADAQYDAVVSLEVLEHLTNPFNAVAELSRILRCGGELFLTLPDFWSARSRWRFLWRGSVNRSRVRDEACRRALVSGACPPHINTMPWTTLKFALVAYGFEVLELEGYRRRLAPHLPYLPLASAIWLSTRVARRSRRDRYELDESNRWSILLGSQHVYIRARKLRDVNAQRAQRAAPRSAAAPS